MAKKNREVLKSYFKAGEIPTQQHYEELIDSMLNLQEDGIENDNKDIKVAEGLLLTPGGCLNTTGVHNRQFLQGAKIKTSIPFSLTVKGPPVIIIEGYEFEAMQTIGLMVPFEYEYDDANFSMSDTVEEDLRQEIARLSTRPISSALVKVQGKKPDPSGGTKKITATWIVDAKQPELVWEVIANDQNIVQIVNTTLADLNTLSALKIKTKTGSKKAIATAWGSYRPPIKLIIEEGKMTLLILKSENQKIDPRMSFNIRTIGGAADYENWHKQWQITAATEEEIADAKKGSIDVEYTT